MFHKIETLKKWKLKQFSIEQSRRKFHHLNHPVIKDLEKLHKAFLEMKKLVKNLVKKQEHDQRQALLLVKEIQINKSLILVLQKINVEEFIWNPLKYCSK